MNPITRLLVGHGFTKWAWQAHMLRPANKQGYTVIIETVSNTVPKINAYVCVCWDSRRGLKLIVYQDLSSSPPWYYNQWGKQHFSPTYPRQFFYYCILIYIYSRNMSRLMICMDQKLKSSNIAWFYRRNTTKYSFHFI